MKLTDQEQVVLKAIGSGVAEVSRVIRSVGYPKATVKKVLVRLNERGIVALHRHDYPQSLTPDQRKMMVRIGRDYFNAVSMRKKNPTILDEKIPMRDVATTMLALSRSPFDGMIGAYGDDVRGAYAHPKILYLLFYAGDVKQEDGEYRIPYEAVQRATRIVDKFYNDKRKSISGKQFLNVWRKMKRNPQKSKGKTALKKTGRALKGFAQGALSSAAQILGAGAEALNPRGKHLPGLPAKAQREYEKILREAKRSGRYKGREKEVAARTVRKKYGKNSARFSAAQWANEMARLRDIKPRPLHKLYGRSGGTPDQQAAWKEAMKEWNRQYRHASKMQKIALEEDNAAFRARQAQNKTVIRAGRIDHLDVAKIHNPNNEAAREMLAKLKRAGIPVKDVTVLGAFAHLHMSSAAGANKAASMLSSAGFEVKIKSPRETYKREWLVIGKASKRNASRTISAKSSKTRRAGASSAGRKTKKTSLRSVAKTRKVTTRRASKRTIKKRNALKRAKMPAWIKTALKNAKVYGADRAGIDAFMHASKAQRDAFDQYLVSVGHPSAYEPGTQEHRIRRFVRERVGKRGRRNPSAESIRKTFAGSVNGERDLFFPQGTPSGKLAKLGRLVSITTEAGTIKPVHGTAWLCADTRGKLHIGATSNAPLYSGPARNFGHVTKLEYESSKPHLGYRGPIIWFHKAGEENGVRPTLRADGKGGLVFRGGAYRLTERGIEN